MPLLAVWGAAVIAEPGQFSAAATELAEPGFSGSALTLQTALGLCTHDHECPTGASSRGSTGRRFALAALTIGLALGTLAMLRLRRKPQATLMAGPVAAVCYRRALLST